MIGVIVAAVLMLVMLLNGGRSGEIENGSIRLELDVSAVIIRDETVVNTERYDKMYFDFHVQEGAKEHQPQSLAGLNQSL